MTALAARAASSISVSRSTNSANVRLPGSRVARQLLELLAHRRQPQRRNWSLQQVDRHLTVAKNSFPGGSGNTPEPTLGRGSATSAASGPTVRRRGVRGETGGHLRRIRAARAGRRKVIQQEVEACRSARARGLAARSWVDRRRRVVERRPGQHAEQRVRRASTLSSPDTVRRGAPRPRPAVSGCSFAVARVARAGAIRRTCRAGSSDAGAQQLTGRAVAGTPLRQNDPATVPGRPGSGARSSTIACRSYERACDAMIAPRHHDDPVDVALHADHLEGVAPGRSGSCPARRPGTCPRRPRGGSRRRRGDPRGSSALVDGLRRNRSVRNAPRATHRAMSIEHAGLEGVQLLGIGDANWAVANRRCTALTVLSASGFSLPRAGMQDLGSKGVMAGQPTPPGWSRPAGSPGGSGSRRSWGYPRRLLEERPRRTRRPRPSPSARPRSARTAAPAQAGRWSTPRSPPGTPGPAAVGKSTWMCPKSASDAGRRCAGRIERPRAPRRRSTRT